MKYFFHGEAKIQQCRNFQYSITFCFIYDRSTKEYACYIGNQWKVYI